MTAVENELTPLPADAQVMAAPPITVPPIAADSGLDLTPVIRQRPAEVTPSARAEPTRRRWWPGRWPGRRMRTDIGVLVAYAAIALYVTQNLWRHPHGYTIATNPTDQTQFEYFLEHAVRVVTGGQNPFFTGLLNAPDGVNLMANTATLGLHLPLVPVTLLFGPSVSFTVMVMFSMLGTAAGWYWLFSRKVVASRFAAAIAGGFAGFAPGMVSQANGHPNIATQVLVPFLVWWTFRLREPGRAVRNGLVLGLLATYQAFINEEVLLLTALALGVFVLAWAAYHRSEAARVWRGFLAGLGTAALVGTVLLGYPLYVQFFGRQSYHGLGTDVRTYGSDLLSFAGFARYSFAGHPGLSDRLAQNPSEQNAFFGIPLLILTVMLAIWLWKRVVVRCAVITAGVLALLALGPRIRIDGDLTPVPGPYALLSRVPVFDSVIATRLVLAAIPVVALLLALWLEAFLALPRPAAARLRPRLPAVRLFRLRLPGRSLPAIRVPRLGVPRLMAIGLVAAALLPVAPTPIATAHRTPTPVFFTSGEWRAFVPAGRTVVTVPVTSLMYAMDGMAWAVDQHLDFAIAGGYFLGPNPERNGQGMFGSPGRPTSTIWAQVAKDGKMPRITAAQRAQTVEDLRYWRAAVVVMEPRAHDDALREVATQLIGYAPQWMNGVWVWDVRPIVG